MSAPLAVLTKGAATLNENMIFDVQSLCWEMILNDNKDISTSSGALLLYSDVLIGFVIEYRQFALK